MRAASVKPPRLQSLRIDAVQLGPRPVVTIDPQPLCPEVEGDVVLAVGSFWNALDMGSERPLEERWIRPINPASTGNVGERP